ncbi:hypothetical protein FOS14_03895 [Skermania sp. ID1734]|nr:hypothetical protein FOS14_03895 [Skermania sp. ID1734]
MRRRAVLAAAACALVTLTGCSSGSSGAGIQTIQPATPAKSPAVTTAPAGQVVASAPIRALITDSAAAAAVAVLGDGTELELLNLRSPGTTPRVIHLPGVATSLSPGNPGEALVTVGRSVVRVDLAHATTKVVDVSGDATAAAVLPGDRLAVGTDQGELYVYSTDGSSPQRISGLASVDALAVTGSHLSALDRRQTSLTEYDLDAGKLGLSLRAGDGATNLATDHYGRILVTDTAGNELLVYTAGPLILRQRFPVPGAPYAVTYDDHHNLVWLTLSASNEVVGYDLASGMPREVARYPTVQQPNSVAVDPGNGDVLVGSATGGGLQRIALQEGR